MKTKSKINAYILRGSMAALLFSCVIVVLCSAINLPEQPRKVLPPQDNAGFGANAHQSVPSVPASTTRNTRSLTFVDRVAYQRAIEEVYWRHRIWPKERPNPKPEPDAAMSQAQIERKVEDYLRNSQALEDYWQRPITADQLQAEMERMASHTKQPDVLRELFAALGNDPFVIAECLAKPVLAERIGNGDPVAAEPALSAIRTGVPTAHPAQMPPQKPALAGWLARAETEVPRKVAAIDSIAKAVQVNRPYTLPVIAGPSGGCIDDTWTPTTLTNAPTVRYYHRAVWTGSEMIVWGGCCLLNTGGRYNPTTDSWAPTTTTNAPASRERFTAVWTGSEMIVWGGDDEFTSFNTGGRYNPSTDSWTATSTTGAPSARFRHTAVWTGSEMIVWGGCASINCSQVLNTGGRYNPSTDSWTATSTTNAPDGRGFHTAVWTDSEMIVWGGRALGPMFVNTGGRYNPGTDSWTATSTTNAPTARELHTAVWTSSEMIIWGGCIAPFCPNPTNTGGRYDPGTDGWTPTSTTNAPSGRRAHTAVWTPSEMIVWGGFAAGQLNTGGRYNPVIDSWTPTSTTNAPSTRADHTAVWTDSEMIVWGGAINNSSGGRYCAAAGGPTPTPTPSPTPTATATATATATVTATPTATVRPTPTPRLAPTPRPRPTPAPRP